MEDVSHFEIELKKLRDEIDEIDRSLVRLISERMKIVREIGRLKKEFRKPVVDRERELSVIRKVLQMAEAESVNTELVLKIFSLLMEESRRIQREIERSG